jgi:hypothetical protein
MMRHQCHLVMPGSRLCEKSVPACLGPFFVIPAQAEIQGLQPLPWAPGFEGVRKSTIGWISAVRPSRQLLRSFLRTRSFLNAIEDFLMLRSAQGRVSKHARPHCRQFADTLLRRDDRKGPERLRVWFPLMLSVSERSAVALSDDVGFERA